MKMINLKKILYLISLFGYFVISTCLLSNIHNQKHIVFAQDVTKDDLTSGIIKGVITDKETGGVISKANVFLEQSNIVITSITTSIEGTYLFTVPAGEYDIKVNRSGFKRGNDIITVVDTDSITKNIELVPIKTSTDLNQSIKSTGTQLGTTKTTSSVFGFLSGSVFDKRTGSIVPEANVTVNRSTELVSSAITDVDGVYFFQLIPGTYSVLAEKEEIGTNTISVNVNAFEITGQDILLAAAEETATPTPEATPTPSPVPTETPIEEVCIPDSIGLLPATLTMNPGQTKRVRIKVGRDRKLFGCSVAVEVDCQGNCDLFNGLKDSVVTNKRGVTFIKIQAKRGQLGSAKIEFSVGDVRTVLPVIIRKVN